MTLHTHTYSTRDVAVNGGDMRVAVWEPTGDVLGTLLLVHGVTASHKAWQWLPPHLSGYRLIAPDLRGRGQSRNLTGPAGYVSHADDLDRVCESLGLGPVAVCGHSMGAFVGFVFAHRHPGRVSQLLPIDGGLPLDVPVGLSADEVVAAVLGPTAARLSMTFESLDDYLDFWRVHPAFEGVWSPLLKEYFGYDLVSRDGALRPATSYQVTAEDTMDLNTGTALPDALAALSHPTALLTVPFGLQNEPPGLYAPEYLSRVLPRYPAVAHTRLDHLNHYTILMTDDGAATTARFVLDHINPSQGAG